VGLDHAEAKTELYRSERADNFKTTVVNHIDLPEEMFVRVVFFVFATWFPEALEVRVTGPPTS